MTIHPNPGPTRNPFWTGRSMLRALDSSTTLLWAIALLVIAWIASTLLLGYPGLITGALTAMVLGFYLLIRITLG